MSSDPEISRLSTWAEIAAYIGRDVRTAKRYEIERGLPVRRLPGSRSPVFALARDLDAWRAGPSHEPLQALDPERPAARPPPTAAATAMTAPHHRRPSLRVAAVLLLACVVATGAAALAMLRPAAPALPARASAEARALTDEGGYAWNRRTPEGIAAAVDRFTQAVVRDPDYPAYAGLANAYNLSPEFSDMRPQDAYPRARAAAERAITLAPGSAAAHRALAFESFWWERDAPRSLAEFRTALALDPSSALTHLWYANVLAAELDPRALDEVRRALQLDPASTAARADEGWIEYMLGHPRDAIATLSVVAAADPGYSAVYRYREQAETAAGDDLGMLRDLRREGELTHDPVLTRLASAGLAVAPGGRAPSTPP